MLTGVSNIDLSCVNMRFGRRQHQVCTLGPIPWRYGCLYLVGFEVFTAVVRKVLSSGI
jgi:hypothetical protein